MTRIKIDYNAKVTYKVTEDYEEICNINSDVISYRDYITDFSLYNKYSETGKIVYSSNSATGATIYEYDELDRLVKEKNQYWDFYEVHEYDEAGNVSSYCVYPDGRKEAVSW